MSRQLSPQQLQNQVTTFNKAYKVGDKVKVSRVSDGSDPFEDEISHEATIMGGHTAMTWLKEKGGFILSNF